MQFRHSGILNEERVMPVGKKSFVGRNLIITLLLFSLCVTGTLVALNHTRSVAAAASTPYYLVSVGGQRYAAQYVGGESSSHNSSSSYSNFGKWNEYVIDASGKAHFWGQFSGTDEAYFNSQGKIVGGVNVNVPGVGHIDTYTHQQTLGPDLPALQFPYESPSQYTYQGSTSTHETYLGTRTAERFYTSRTGGAGIGTTDCQVDAGNFDYGRLGWQTDNVEMTTRYESARDADCIRGQAYLQQGDGVLTNYFNQLVQRVGAVRNANAPVVASLQQRQVVLSTALALSGTFFFVAAITSSNICTFLSCGETAKKILAAVSIGMAIMSAGFGTGATIVAGERAAMAIANTVGLGARAGGLTAEVMGALEMTGAAGTPALAVAATAEAGAMAEVGAIAIAVIP